MSNKPGAKGPSQTQPTKGGDRVADGDLVAQKREFIETFFKRGAELTEELMRENERLRFRVIELEGATSSTGTVSSPSTEDLPTLRARLDRLERERDEILQRARGVEQLNQDYVARYQEIERENNNLANLYVAAHQLHSTMELREVTQTIVEIVLNFIGAKTFAIQLVDEERAVLRTLAAEGVERGRVPERSLDPETLATAIDPIAEVMRTGRAVFARGPLTARPIGSPPAASVPIKIADRVVGIISVWELLSQKSELVDVDFELFNLLGDHAGAALQGAKLAAELHGRPPALWVAADLV